jgi:hypothetical protein
LPALDAIEYVQSDNPLAVALAALMKIPPGRAAWLGAEALRRIQETSLSDQRKFMLGECVQAYLPLDEEQCEQFERLITSEPYSGVKAMNITSHEKGIMTGIGKGKCEILQGQLEELFGPLKPDLVERLWTMPDADLIRLSKALLKAKSLEELGLEESHP